MFFVAIIWLDRKEKQSLLYIHNLSCRSWFWRNTTRVSLGRLNRDVEFPTCLIHATGLKRTPREPSLWELQKLPTYKWYPKGLTGSRLIFHLRGWHDYATKNKFFTADMNHKTERRFFNRWRCTTMWIYIWPAIVWLYITRMFVLAIN